MKTTKDEGIRHLNLRLDDTLLQALKQRATENHRSLNAEIIYTLQQSRKEKKGK